MWRGWNWTCIHHAMVTHSPKYASIAFGKIVVHVLLAILMHFSIMSRTLLASSPVLLDSPHWWESKKRTGDEARTSHDSGMSLSESRVTDSVKWTPVSMNQPGPIVATPVSLVVPVCVNSYYSFATSLRLSRSSNSHSRVTQRVPFLFSPIHLVMDRDTLCYNSYKLL